MYFHAKNGYVGAYHTDGFTHPALLKLASELQQAMPDLMDGYALDNLWSYKAHQAAPAAVRLHADAADLNFNFWVTDSSANLDPEGGGLIVHKTASPPEWGFSDFNDLDNIAKMQEFLQDVNSTEVVVPFRQGRCVMFNSSLFHQTDNHTFQPGYSSRRINFTLLFSRIERMWARPGSGKMKEK